MNTKLLRLPLLLQNRTRVLCPTTLHRSKQQEQATHATYLQQPHFTPTLTLRKMLQQLLHLPFHLHIQQLEYLIVRIPLRQLLGIPTTNKPPRPHPSRLNPIKLNQTFEPYVHLGFARHHPRFRRSQLWTQLVNKHDHIDAILLSLTILRLLNLSPNHPLPLQELLNAACAPEASILCIQKQFRHSPGFQYLPLLLHERLKLAPGQQHGVFLTSSLAKDH